MPLRCQLLHVILDLGSCALTEELQNSEGREFNANGQNPYDCVGMPMEGMGLIESRNIMTPKEANFCGTAQPHTYHCQGSDWGRGGMGSE